VAKALLEFETLSGDEIINVMKGVPPVRVELRLFLCRLPVSDGTSLDLGRDARRGGSTMKTAIIALAAATALLATGAPRPRPSTRTA
jgi:hypothetical protein